MCRIVIFLLLVLLALTVRGHYILYDPFAMNTRYDMGLFLGYYALLKEDAAGALATGFTKLGSVYLYLWSLLGMTDLRPDIAIKASAALFDLACAFWVYKIVRLRRDAGISCAAAALTLFAPVVLMNASMWGQLDAMYSSFLLACIYFMMQGRTHAAIFCFAIACCFKLQSVFLLPAIAYFWAARMFPLRYLLWIPALYLTMQLPRYWLGLPFIEMIAPYAKQIGTHKSLTIYAPNLFGLLDIPPIFMGSATWMGLMLGGIVMMAAYFTGREDDGPSKGKILMIATLSLLLLPYVLPRMHERYFFPAALAVIALAFHYRALIIPAILVNIFAAWACIYYIGRQEIPLQWLSLGMGIAVLCFALFFLCRWGVRKDQGGCIYITCGNAAHNRGDRGNITSEIAAIKEAFPQKEIVLDSYRPEVDRYWYGCTVIRRGMLPTREQIHYLRRAEVVVWGGGALIADNGCRLLVPHQWLSIFFIKHVMGKKVMAWAHGVVLATRMGRMFGRWALGCADVITVRDENSSRAVRSLGLQAELTADHGILLSCAPKDVGEKLLAAQGIASAERPLIAITPTFWHLYHDAKRWLPYPMDKRPSHAALLEEYKQGLAALAGLLVEEGAEVVLLPRYPHEKWNDTRYCHEIRAMSGDHVHVYDDDAAAPASYFSMWHSFDMVISVALHDAMFALATERPCLHLYYEEKGTDLFRAVHAEAHLLHWRELLSEEGRRAIMEAMRRIRRLAPPDVGILKERAGGNVRLLKEFMAGSRGFEPPT